MLEATAIYPWKAYQCAQTLCICIIWMRGAVQIGCQPQPWRNDIILTPRVTQNHNYEPSRVGITVWGYCHMSMDSISMCSNTLLMYDVDAGCRKQFELAVSLNHDVMTSFWLHKWPRTPKLTQLAWVYLFEAASVCPKQYINVLKHFSYV
jgi:hypothetical protein